MTDVQNNVISLILRNSGKQWDSYAQWSAVIRRSILSRFYTRHCNNSSRTWIRLETQNRHPLPRPNGRAMGVCCEDIRENGTRYIDTALYFGHSKHGFMNDMLQVLCTLIGDYNVNGVKFGALPFASSGSHSLTGYISIVIEILWNLFFSIFIISIISGHHFAHITTAQLYWHVLNYDIVWSFLFT